MGNFINDIAGKCSDWYQDNNLFVWVSVGLAIGAVLLFYYSVRCDHDE